MAEPQDVPGLTDLAADLAGEPEDVKDEPVVEDATPADPSPEENKDPAAPEPAKEPEAEPAPTDEENPDEPAPEEEPAPEPEPALSPAEERKQQLNTEIRDLVTRRRDLLNQVETLNSQVYAPQTTEEIMQETGQSEAEARITAMEQRQELQAYNTQVAESQLVISTESQRVLQDFPMFDPTNEEAYKPEVAEQAAQIIANSLIRDPNTQQVIGSNLPIYQFYQTIASANQASAVENQLKGQQSTHEMLAAAEPSSSAVPAQPPEDPFLAGLTKGYGEKLSGS